MMKKIMNILIVPDVHGRESWKDAVKKGSFDKVVFLGDYLDTYFFDTVYFKITDDSAVENLKEIIAYKKENPDSVVLLIGNHDCTYIYGKSVCDSRCIESRYDEIRALFQENRHLFQMAWEVTLRKKRYVFSHAGISAKWMNRYVKGWTIDNMVELLNEKHRKAVSKANPEDTPFARALSVTGKYRGFSTWNYGSPVWMDAELLHETEPIGNLIQVVGHTQRTSWSPVITPEVLYMDCGGQSFLLNSYGTIRTLRGAVCKNEYPDPFDPYKYEESQRGIELDCFSRPYCRKCGSRTIYVRAGTFVDTYTCAKCGTTEHM